jgi:hypothetical protein
VDVFDLDRSLVSDYEKFSRSFSIIKADDLKHGIDAIYSGRRFWPEPLLQLNPHYARGGSVLDLVHDRTLDAGCAAYFRDPSGRSRTDDPSLKYWNGRCPLTGITEPELLRASHIVPWAACETDAERLDVHNGLLLSALWDAAFDTGLVSFGDDGRALASPRLDPIARKVLALDTAPSLKNLQNGHRANLALHRARYGFQ